MHEADGRHRIRPAFLAEYFPEAKDKLEAGIVVNNLGGEENVDAVATHGTLLSSAGDDPFTWNPEPMERAIMPLIGTREEIAHEAP